MSGRILRESDIGRSGISRCRTQPKSDFPVCPFPAVAVPRADAPARHRPGSLVDLKPKRDQPPGRPPAGLRRRGHIARLARAPCFGRERCELLTAEGCTRDAPATFGSLGEQHPCATGLGRVARDFRDDLADLLNELLLARATLRHGRAHDLNAHRASARGSRGLNR